MTSFVSCYFGLGFVNVAAYFSPHPNPERCGLSTKPFFLLWTKSVNYANIIYARACNSAGECHLHTVEVVGSNPIAPKHEGPVNPVLQCFIGLKLRT